MLRNARRIACAFSMTPRVMGRCAMRAADGGQAGAELTVRVYRMKGEASIRAYDHGASPSGGMNETGGAMRRPNGLKAFCRA